MSNFKFDIKNIKDKINYAKQLLSRNDLSPIERERIKHSLIAYYAILDSSDSVYNRIITPFLDKISNGKYSSNIDSNRLCKTGDILLDKDSYGLLTKDYLQVLINLASKIQKPQIESTKFEEMSFSDVDLKNITLSFYKSLDSEMEDIINKIISTPGLVNVTEYRTAKNIDGVTFYDYIENVPFVNVSRAGTIEDAQVFAHELMHATDFVMQPKYYDSNYYGFHETPTYCNDLLFADFMESNGIDSNEVNKIRSERINYIRGLAYQALFQIRSKIGRETFMSGDINSIYNAVDEDILKKLLEVQSGIMAVGLYTQIKHNKENGINNLKTFMSNMIPKTNTPDFSKIGLDYNTLMKICENIKTYGFDFGGYNLENEIYSEHVDFTEREYSDRVESLRSR